MSRKLWECFTELLEKHCALDKAEAFKRLKDLREREFFIEDVWS